MKLAIITCYKQPDYIRAQTLRTAASHYPDAELIIVKNRHAGLLRYPEIFWKSLVVRFKQKPDVYLITFRGYEILPWLALISWPQTLIYDEFVNPLEWLNEPQTEWWVRLVPKALLRGFYRLLLKRSQVILTDTEAHAKSSRRLNGQSRASYYALPVSTDETVFKPATHKPADKFQIFYYCNMRPLHGLPHVLEAAVELKNKPIEFLIVGGGQTAKDAVDQANQQGAHITYKTWIPFKQLPDYIHQADLCLGGPFGDTVQARQVITGKTYQFLASARPTVVGQGQATGQFADKQNCLLVPLGDTPALAAAIQWAADHPDQLAQIAQAGRQLYEETFSQAQVARQLAPILDQLA